MPGGVRLSGISIGFSSDKLVFNCAMPGTFFAYLPRKGPRVWRNFHRAFLLTNYRRKRLPLVSGWLPDLTQYETHREKKSTALPTAELSARSLRAAANQQNRTSPIPSHNLPLLHKNFIVSS